MATVTIEPVAPFSNPLWNIASAARDLHLIADANDQIGALSAAFAVLDAAAAEALSAETRYIVVDYIGFEHVFEDRDRAVELSNRIRTAARAEGKAEGMRDAAKLVQKYAGQFPAYPEFDAGHNAAVDIGAIILASLPSPPADGETKL